MEALLQQIISKDFGQTAKDITSCLQKHGHQTLKALVSLTEYAFIDIRNMLIILIKCNCVKIKPIFDEDIEAQINYYDLNREYVLCRLRYPRYLLIDIFPELADIEPAVVREVLGEVIEYGSLSLEELTEHYKDHPGGSHLFENIFKKLVSKGFLIRSDYDIQEIDQAENGKKGKGFE